MAKRPGSITVARILDASEVEEQLYVAREQNEYARQDPNAAVNLFEEGPLRFLMLDLATELLRDPPAPYLRPDGPNVEAGAYFSRVMGETVYSFERHAAEGLVWAHLAAGDWRQGYATPNVNLDMMERCVYLLVAERLRLVIDHTNTTPRPRTAAQDRAASQARASKAVADAERKTRIRALAEEFPDRRGGELVYAIQAAWEDRWPGEKVPSRATIYRCLGG